MPPLFDADIFAFHDAIDFQYNVTPARVTTQQSHQPSMVAVADAFAMPPLLTLLMMLLFSPLPPPFSLIR